LFIYPLKSAAGLRVAEAALDRLGFAGDRRWMVVDAERRFLSQRRLPPMALIQATALGDGLFLSAPGMPSLHVPRPASGPVLDVVIWDDAVRAEDAGDDAARWVSTVLHQDARLVRCPPERARAVDPTYARDTDVVGFADGFPLLVLGHASVCDINRRLREQGMETVGVERFRPNIVIEGAEPYAEDAWSHIRIGAIAIDIVKPCARCSTISVEPRTGVQGVEPMRTLLTYRQRGQKVYVAQNALHRACGTITTGDEVTVL
jgi:uncharacterized protein YcbX